MRQRVARKDGSGNVSYYLEEPAGRTRTITGANGVACNEADNFLFGGEQSYGNTTATAGGTQITFDTNNTNRISYISSPATPIRYDAAGNVIEDMSSVPCHTYQWDAEGRMKSVDATPGQSCLTTANTVSTFNALGQRVDHTGGSIHILYLYGADGQEIGDWRIDANTWGNAYFNLNGRPIAKYMGGRTWFMHLNHLGSTTMVTDDAGAVQEKILYYPYGSIQVLAGLAATGRFASLREGLPGGGQEISQSETRDYPSRHYRWMSPDEFTGGPVSAYGPPDPAPSGALPYADITNPQSLNKYAYVYNNPLRYNDPTGHWCIWGLGTTCVSVAIPKLNPPPPPPPWTKGNPLYANKDLAGKGAVHALRAAAAKNPVEYGNVIVKVGKVGWTYGDPVTQGSKKTVNPDASPWTGTEPATTPTKWNPLPMAPGLTKGGEAHVHVRLAGYEGTRFSFEDVDRAGLQGITSYLGPTQGGVLKYDPNTDQQSWLEPPDQ